MSDAGKFHDQNAADRSNSIPEKAAEWTAPHRTPIGIEQTHKSGTTTDGTGVS